MHVVLARAAHMHHLRLSGSPKWSGLLHAGNMCGRTSMPPRVGWEEDVTTPDVCLNWFFCLFPSWTERAPFLNKYLHIHYKEYAVAIAVHRTGKTGKMAAPVFSFLLSSFLS